MNLFRKSINEPEESKTETYKSKVKELESLNDILKNENQENYVKKLSKEDQTKLKNQNLYFKDFLTGNLCKIMHNRGKSTRYRKNSFLNLEELKNLKKRASFLGRKNEALFFSPKAKEVLTHTNNYQRLGFLDTSPEKPRLGIQNEFRLTMGTPNNFLLQNRTEIDRNININDNNNFNNENFTENLANMNNHINNNIDNYHKNKYLQNHNNKNKNNKFNNNENNGEQNNQNTEFNIITEEKTYDANVISKANTIGIYNTPALHPRLSIRVHKFLNDLQRKTQRFSKEEFDSSLYQNTENDNASYDVLGNTRKLDNTNINFSLNNEIRLDFNKNNNSIYDKNKTNKNKNESVLRNFIETKPIRLRNAGNKNVNLKTFPNNQKVFKDNASDNEWFCTNSIYKILYFLIFKFLKAL